MANVSISKGLLAGLVASCLTSLLAVAFLLGRATATKEAPFRVQPSNDERRPSTSHPADENQRRGSLGEPQTSAPTPVRDPFLQPLPRGESAPVPAQAAPPAPVDDPDRRAVEAYFSSLDQIQPGGLTGSPDSIANEMAAALAKGDSSSLDSLIQQLQGAKDRLLGVSPPAPCTAHHRETLASAESALEMLRALKRVTESADPASLLAEISSQATTLRTRTEALKREEEVLKARYGLTR